jgi:hypothetical protein
MTFFSRLFSRRLDVNALKKSRAPDVDALKKSGAIEQLTALLAYQGPGATIAENLEIRLAAARALAEVRGSEARGPIEKAYADTLDVERTLAPAFALAPWSQEAQHTGAALETAKRDFRRLLGQLTPPIAAASLAERLVTEATHECGHKSIEEGLNAGCLKCALAFKSAASAAKAEHSKK